MIFFDRGRKIFVVLIEFRRLVNKVKNPKRIIFKEINNWFIILKADIMRKFSQSLSHKLVLLLFENIRNIKLLQFLVGKINEKLLQ